MHPKRHQRAPSDSKAAQAARAADVKTTIPPPDGVRLRTKAARLLWDQYTSSRLSSDWLVADLILVGELVDTVLRERKLRTRLEKEGYTYEDEKGALKANPLANEVGRAVNQKLSIYRMLGFSSANVSVSSRNAAPKSTDVQAAEKGKTTLLAVA